jgi:Zn-finger nucleic acid-binding protein
MSINCPKCKTPTSVFNFESDLNFDRCNTCSGMWLDQGEIARAAGGTEDFPEPERAKSGPMTDMTCPKCDSSRLHEVAFAPNTKIIVEACQKCMGVWLDSRELGQIQEILRKFRIADKKKRIQSL